MTARLPRPDLAWPFLAGLALLVGVPLVGVLALAFTEFAGVGAPRFHGLGNFRRLVGDEALWQAFGNTAVYVAVAVPLRLLGALSLALLLHRPGTGAAAGRAVAYLPSIIPEVSYALLWAWLLNPLYGPLAALGSTAWLTEPWSARVAVAVMGGFQVGEGFLVALAWRRALPSRLYEAAAVDGARPWYVLRRVTLPLMAPVLALLALRDVALALQVGMAPALLVTRGGPRKATTYVPVYLYDAAFRYFRFGYAAAVSVAMLVVTLAVAALMWRLARRWRLL